MLFPDLPVLRCVQEMALSDTRALLRDSVLVGVQHLLRTTGSLLETLVDLGLEPSRTFMAGKPYSTHLETAQKITNELRVRLIQPAHGGRPGEYQIFMDRAVDSLWQLATETIDRQNPRLVIVLDDGGYSLRRIPRAITDQYRVIGIEQTSYGLITPTPFPHLPTIQVASSAIKRHLESPLIAKAIHSKVDRVLDGFDPDIKCGVVGIGSLGSSVAERLVSAGHVVYTYDVYPERANSVEGARYCSADTELFQHADVIFGCTGNDISNAPWRNNIIGEKVLVSCSSSDVEFRSLLQDAHYVSGASELQGFTQDVELMHPEGHLKLRVLRGGTPINFDGSPDSVPAKDIQLTRGLLLAAVLQATGIVLDSSPSSPGGVMLDPLLQRLVAKSWIKDQPHRRELYAPSLQTAIESVHWIEEASGGYYMPSTIMKRMLQNARNSRGTGQSD